MDKPKTIVDSQKAAYDRNAYIEIIDDEVVYDTSDDEYGPIYFPLEQLEQKIKEHKEKLNG